MRQQSIALSLLACITLGMPVACGDGDSSSSPIETGIAKDKPVSQMTPDEAQKICDAVAQTATEKLQSAEVQKGICGFTGYMAASGVDMEDLTAADVGTGSIDPATACQETYTACMAQPPTAEATETIESCEIPELDCAATVGEVEACLNEATSSMSKLLKALPDCSDLGKELDQNAIMSAIPQKCLELQTKCPEAFSGVTTDDSFASAARALSLVKTVRKMQRQ